MIRLKNLKIYTSAGQLGIISLKRFMNDLVQRRLVDNNSRFQEYFQFKEFPPLWANESDLITELPYHKAVIELKKQNSRPEEILRYELLKNAKLKDVEIKDLRHLIHEATDQYCLNFGEPTHLVRIEQRLWMVTNPEDFRIIVNPHGYSGLCVLQPQRLMVYDIHKDVPNTFKIKGAN